MAFFQTAAKRLATSGRFLMKSLVMAQPAANALPFSSPRMYLVITPASIVRATPSLRMVEACGSSVYPASKVPDVMALTCWPMSS
jgi:hypothetical protein